MLRCMLFVFLLVSWVSFMLASYVESRVVQAEVDVLEEMATSMGLKDWKFNPETCKFEMTGMTATVEANVNVSVNCSQQNGTDWHVHQITLKRLSLPGLLPTVIAKLPYLTYIDFAYNYFNGTIPPEWFSMKLTFISVLGNRLSGNIPKGLGNMTSLTYLNLEANQFSGPVPSELGDLTNLEILILSSNNLTGNIPASLVKLSNLKDFRINDNNLNGSIPNYIQSWVNLTKLELQASGLHGPIPSNISQLSNLEFLRISNIEGPDQELSSLGRMTKLKNMILRSCNLVGEIPSDLFTLDFLELLDVSFNKLTGAIPSKKPNNALKFMFLTGNLLSGDIPDTILKRGYSVDLSYNNLTVPDRNRFCDDSLDLDINLYRSGNLFNSSRRATNPCLETDTCSKYSSCLYVHTGGDNVVENKTQYKGDGREQGSAAKLFIDDKHQWGFSSTGDFLDDSDELNRRCVEKSNASSLSSLYRTARVAPITLTYFHRCLKNGNYTVTLHFAELQFTNDGTYNSLGRRVFDIYVQDRLVQKDFNILNHVAPQQPFPYIIKNVSVSSNFLEVRLYFAGKGTTRFPDRGAYGPIISALSFVSDSEACSSSKDKKPILITAGVVGTFCLILILIGVIFWRHHSKKKWARKELDVLDDLPSGTFSLKQIKSATNDFSAHNKIGEGGFGPVYKGVLPDGTVVAVKQLSSKSRQGNREFMNEIGMISCLRHPNLVKLHGFCVEGDQLLLVYEYMENNSLARALFGPPRERIQLDWVTRHKICLGIARGLAFLHDESRLKIVHRDIKTTNVLLDKNLNPKISDFGLARLDERENTHISTRIAGTIGYMAPEYAMWGYLTHKVDIYGFGVVTLEIISGKSNNDPVPRDDCFCYLDWARYLNESGKIMDVVDMTLRDNLNKEEMEMMLKVALLCTNTSPTLRPSMSEVVAMLEGRLDIPEVPEATVNEENERFKVRRDSEQMKRDQNSYSKETTSLLIGPELFSQNL